MDTGIPARKIGPHWLWALAAFAIGVAYIYRSLLNGVTSGLETETRIQIAILQGWSNCLSGYGSCLTPNFFHPLRGTLGYNDGYLISGLLYHLLRLAGLDPLLAYDLLYIPIRLAGFVAIILLGVRFLKLPPWAAICAAWLSLISINMLNQIVHTQLIYGAFGPLGLLLVLCILDRLAPPDDSAAPAPAWRTAMLIGAFGIFCAAWAVTAFYSFFFFVMFMIVFLPLYAFVRWRLASQAAMTMLRSPILVATAAAGATLTPLALWLVYGGTLAETGGHRFQAAYNPRIYDLFHVGSGNLIWAPILKPIYAMVSGQPLETGEQAAGFPVLFVVCLALSTVYLFRLARRMPAPPAAFQDDHSGFAVALGLASVFIVIATIRIGGGYSLWYVFWKLLPGASAIRVPYRFLLFATPLLCLTIMYVVAEIYRTQAARGRAATVAVAVLVAALTIEQYNNRATTYFHINRETELAFLTSVPAPPPGCRAFYVSVPRPDPSSALYDEFYVHAADAMMIAALQRIPTLNGMASFLPREWNLTSPFAPDYVDRVMRYAKRHGVSEGLCSLDLKAIRWGTG